jgi:hypothetical protein
MALFSAGTVHADGRIDAPWWAEEVGGGPPVTFEPEGVTATPDGRRITVRGNSFSVTERPDGEEIRRETGGLQMTWTWDALRGEYVKAERKIGKVKRR